MRRGIIFSMFAPFCLLLSLWRSKFFLKAGALQNKLLITAVRVAETDPVNPNVRASIELAVGFAIFLTMRKQPFGFFSKRGLLQIYILSCLSCINIYLKKTKTLLLQLQAVPVKTEKANSETLKCL